MSDKRTSRTTQAEGDERFVTLGRVSGAHGIRGWVKVHSETSPRGNIFGYTPWTLVRDGNRETRDVEDGRVQGKAVVVKLAGCDDRDAAEDLAGAEILVNREQLPATTRPGEYYWADLVGLEVFTLDGTVLGRIERLFETGANDVIVVKGERERLLPYVWQQVVREVDLEQGVMRVDWDPDF
ncbi:MAG: ribosome maturation factor RimM [Chromatiaceae bacterium]|nr:ribosome maturation factor RimM [Gammaproteobacteria bacterium]MCP5301075.1 ribosome maturation factor RimM [Chromatiaceae bacterium]MCP5421453.1 ribosome maturation factor RimM [Chromatiaceae bacterium]